MYRGVILASLAFAYAGCAKPPPSNSVSQSAFLRVADYHAWTCRELADEASLLTDALHVATEQQQDAEANSRITHNQRSIEAVRNEMAKKKCKA
jgi:hypothetical protein